GGSWCRRTVRVVGAMEDETRRDDESAAERANRELIELLNELRVALPGVQVLFAFLLVVPFSDRFDRLDASDRRVYFAAVLPTCAAPPCPPPGRRRSASWPLRPITACGSAPASRSSCCGWATSSPLSAWCSWRSPWPACPLSLT